VVETLKAAVGETGTLLFPALSYEAVGAENPAFDVRHTPSCVGAMPEWFRQQPGVCRSMSPTHSVCAWGANAVDITSGQQQDNTPVGAHSPFRRLRDVGGQILMLGCGLDPNTSMHGVEELTEPPYLYGDAVAYTCIDWDGTAQEITTRSHNFETQAGYIDQRYGRLQWVLPKSALAFGKIADADSWLIEAKPMWAIAEMIMREDPLFFVDGWTE
jgi:aminoglycoside 3-N-acetyltransferase